LTDSYRGRFIEGDEEVVEHFNHFLAVLGLGKLGEGYVVGEGEQTLDIRKGEGYTYIVRWCRWLTVSITLFSPVLSPTRSCSVSSSWGVPMLILPTDSDPPRDSFCLISCPIETVML